MRKLSLILIGVAFSTLFACHTAYNTGGHSWVKAKPITVARVKQTKQAVIARTTQEVKPVAPAQTPESNTLSASVDNSTPVLTIQKVAAPVRTPLIQSHSALAKVYCPHTKKAATAAPFGEPKCSQRTAFYLSLPPFGLFGFHRFYLGYTFIGILQILTVGGLGLWTLIDIIRIYKGDLTAKDHYLYRRTWYN